MRQEQPDRRGEQLLHATCVAFGPHGVLIRGPSGSGKSDLALRLISQPLVLPLARQGWSLGQGTSRLVADDQVIVWPRGGRLMARAPAALAGMFEVRGLGIIGVETVPEVAVALVADLVDPAQIERLPTEGDITTISNFPLPRLSLAPFEASAPAKLALALANLCPISYD